MQANNPEPAPGTYNEYVSRATWQPSEGLHHWLSRRLLTNFADVAGLVPGATRILEIGTGTGRTGHEALRLGFAEYVGVEPTTALAEAARSRYSLSIIEESLPTLTSIDDGAFDAVFSFHVLEHAPNYHAAREWCAEMVRVTRPGGSILIAAPDARDFGTYFWDSDWSHGWPTTPRRVSQVLRDLGLEVVRESSMHLGGLGALRALAAHLASAVIPTRLVDLATVRAVGRPLASGLKIAMLWGLVFVVARKPLAEG